MSDVAATPTPSAAPAAAPAAPVAGVQAATPEAAPEAGRKRNRYGTKPAARAADAAPAPSASTPAPEPEVQRGWGQPATPEAAPQAATAPQATADAPAQTADAAEAGAPTGATPDTPAATPADAAPDLVAELRRAIPGAPVTDAASLVPYVEALHGQAQGMQELQATVGAVPELAAFFRALDAGTPPRAALVEAFRDAVDAETLRDDDPEAWQALVEREAEKKARTAGQTTRTEALAKQSREAFEGFLSRKAAEPDFDGDRYLADVHTLINGDAVTGRYRGDAPEVLYRGLNHETLVQAAVAEAVAKERAAVLAEVRSGQHTAGTLAAPDLGPNPGPGGHGGIDSLPDVDPSTLSEGERRRFGLAQALHGGGQRNRYGTTARLGSQN